MVMRNPMTKETYRKIEKENEEDIKIKIAQRKHSSILKIQMTVIKINCINIYYIKLNTIYIEYVFILYILYFMYKYIKYKYFTSIYLYTYILC